MLEVLRILFLCLFQGLSLHVFTYVATHFLCPSFQFHSNEHYLVVPHDVLSPPSSLYYSSHALQCSYMPPRQFNVLHYEYLCPSPLLACPPQAVICSSPCFLVPFTALPSPPMPIHCSSLCFLVPFTTFQSPPMLVHCSSLCFIVFFSCGKTLEHLCFRGS